MNETVENVCPRCGATFACGMASGQNSCWCAELPVLQELSGGISSCYCPACLRQLLDLQRAAQAS